MQLRYETPVHNHCKCNKATKKYLMVWWPVGFGNGTNEFPHSVQFGKSTSDSLRWPPYIFTAENKYQPDDITRQSKQNKAKLLLIYLLYYLHLHASHY
jgi:hypothetical protein